MCNYFFKIQLHWILGHRSASLYSWAMLNLDPHVQADQYARRVQRHVFILPASVSDDAMKCYMMGRTLIQLRKTSG
jgi:hypothetical protein